MDERFARVAVIGTGMMGPGIALTLAWGGSRVALVGRSQPSVWRGLATLANDLVFMVAQDILTSDEARVIRERVWGTDDLAVAVAGAGLVQESILEDLDAKRALFRRLESLCGSETLLTSNTSGLLITDIATEMQRPQRAATVHFWNPPHLMPLVEISQGTHTSESTVQALKSLFGHCGKRAVVARRDVPGQIANRLQHALLREAMYMVQEGIASAEDVDLALKMGPGRRWPVYGVLEHQDVVGLDLSLAVQRSLAPDLCREDRALLVLEQLVAEGHLGVKTGRGFHVWADGDAEAVQSRRDRFICMLARDDRNRTHGEA